MTKEIKALVEAAQWAERQAHHLGCVQNQKMLSTRCTCHIGALKKALNDVLSGQPLEPNKGTVFIHVEGGIATLHENNAPGTVAEFLDFDTDGAEAADLCMCEIGHGDAHYHKTEEAS